MNDVLFKWKCPIVPMCSIAKGHDNEPMCSVAKGHDNDNDSFHDEDER